MKDIYSIDFVKILRGLLVAVSVLGLLSTSACSSASSGSGSDSESESTTAFPTGLAVSSPFDTTESDSASLASLTSASESRVAGSDLSVGDTAALGAGPRRVRRYVWATGRIDMILDGRTPSICRFDPELFLRTEADADCYGPVVDYEAHPDAASPSAPNYDGQLPSGDVGIWSETSASEGHACAAAQLNARMEGARDKSLASLMGLASLICTANANSIALPTNATQDLTAEMNALGVADTTFSAAAITHSDVSGSDEWSYALDLEYSPAAATHRIVVAMTHIPGAARGEFRGRLSYRVNDTMIGGNCPTNDVTTNGSLLYDSSARTSMNLEIRQGQFCGHDADGMTDGLVDPSEKYNAVSNTDGWANNFSILTADFDPTTMIGDFAYSWQAGPNDSNSRVFNIHTSAPASGDIPDGQAFFGYGSDIDATTGNVDGFICNWAGPNASHTLQDFAQSQEISFDSTSNLYQSVSANILYAPTNSCDYDGAEDFTYDTDADGSVDSDPAVAIVNDLQSMTDADTDGDLDEIESAGFNLPTAPANL